MIKKTQVTIIVIFIAIASLLNVWMYSIRTIFPNSVPAGDTASLYKGIAPETNPWLEIWQRWDTLHYQAIAEQGYTAFDTALFTPPLYPWLVSLFSSLFFGNTLVAGLFVAGLFALALITIFYKTCEDILGTEKLAFRATLYLILFPSAFFLIAAYTESAFLLFAVLALYFAQKEKWLSAGFCGGLAALVRSPGILIIIPFAYASFKAWQNNKDWRGLLAISLTSFIALIFPLYAWVSVQATPLDIIHAVGRGGYLTVPGLNIFEAIRRIAIGQIVGENILELSFTLTFIALLIPIWQKLPRLYGVYALTMILFLLSRMGEPQPLVSMARYVVAIFPAFMVLPLLAEEQPILHRLFVYVFWGGLLFMAGQFAIWGWVG